MQRCSAPAPALRPGAPRAQCNVWVYCDASGGCGENLPFSACLLKKESGVPFNQDASNSFVSGILNKQS